MQFNNHICLLFIIVLSNFVNSYEKQEDCPCLSGQIDDCVCTADAVDDLNNEVYPLLKQLLERDYFRYFKVFLKHDCPFWSDDAQCALKDCSVQPCPADKVPEGIKVPSTEELINPYHKRVGREAITKNPLNSSTKDQDSVDCDENHGGLGSIDPTLSDQNYEDFVKWQDHDDAQVNFCELDDENSKDLDYVDLLPNPERFTGYKGKSAHRIWKSVYEENCFRLAEDYQPFTTAKNLNAMCFEKRVFYRAVSGLHSSINIHLCSDYFFPPKRKDQPTVSTNTPWSMAKEPSVMYHGKGGHWGPNVEEFLRRFDPKGPGLQYIMNLYFIYLLELRALAKAAPLLASESYFTGNLEEDVRVKEQVTQLLDLARKFPFHFDERVMFAKDDPQSIKLKEEFRAHFHNISRIMKCVGCDKCRLWGRLQIQGLGTAFKILFFGGSGAELDLEEVRQKRFRLTRTELVSLFNAFGRLSNSIHQLGVFNELILQNRTLLKDKPPQSSSQPKLEL